MQTAITNEVPRELPTAMLTESPTNPRRHFDEAFLKELANSIDAQGVLASLLVRPKNQRYEIVFGAQRFRAAQIAGKESVPVEVREMTDAQVLEAQLVENLQRRDVHPLEEARSFKGLAALRLTLSPKRAGRTRFGFSLHPHPAASPHPLAARQESSSSSCTFPSDNGKR